MPAANTAHDHPLAACLAARIRHLRERGGWSIEDCASAAVVATITWRKIEAAHRWPGPDVLSRIATALGVSPADLLGSPKTAEK